jgi:hypothetical protein
MDSAQTLKASRARNIKTKPKINTTPQDFRVAQLQSEIDELREKLSRQTTTPWGAGGRVGDSDDLADGAFARELSSLSL